LQFRASTTPQFGWSHCISRRQTCHQVIQNYNSAQQTQHGSVPTPPLSKKIRFSLQTAKAAVTNTNHARFTNSIRVETCRWIELLPNRLKTIVEVKLANRWLAVLMLHLCLLACALRV
jgi:hypothetical protein